MIIKLAYYYPGFHPDPVLFEGLGAKWTEWELVRGATPRFDCHIQPRVPSWGYEDEAEQGVMVRKLETARAYGFEALVFVSYWYRGRPVGDRPLARPSTLAGREFPRA